MEYLEKLTKEKFPDFLCEFKHAMKRNTLIGYFCSNFISNYVMRYTEPGIYFFGLVDNFDNHLTKTVSETYKFFRLHGLAISPVERIGYKIIKIDDYLKIMNACYDDILESNVINQEEGAVIHFL